VVAQANSGIARIGQRSGRPHVALRRPFALERAAASLIDHSHPAMEGEQTPMAPIRNGLKSSHPGIALLCIACVALALAGCQRESEEPEVPAVVQEPEPEAEPAPEPEPAPDDAAILAIDAFIAEQNVDKSRKRWKTMLEKPPKASFTAGNRYFWNLETNKGAIKVELMPDVAPMHVSSTIYLTRLGFYDDTIFHRVIPRFMAQGGDPTGTGRGGPGYKYAGEFDPSVKHDTPGILSMANSGPGTDGSQFFLTFVKTPHLNGKHTIFGSVVEGMDTAQELEKLGSRGGTTKEKLVLESATISVEGAKAGT
jgi:peptidyl-prolyl cis-trans isomerase B (cyclophilin B)